MKKQQLRLYCDAEFENIIKVLNELTSIIQVNKMDYTIAEKAAVGSFLHNFYNGIENVLKRILCFLDNDIDNTATWHKDLLKSALDLNIIDQDLYTTLLEYLSFRHFFIHAYSFVLNWDDLKPLVESINPTFNKFKSTISKYLLSF